MRLIKFCTLGCPYTLLCVNQFNQDVKTLKNSEANQSHFIEKNYTHYKELCDYDVFAVIKLLAAMNTKHTAVQIAKRLQSRLMPKIVRLDHVDIAYAQKTLTDFKKKHSTDIEDWQIHLIKTPNQSYTAEEDPILVKNENNIVKPLSEMSLMIQAIGDKLELTHFLSIDKSVYGQPSVQNLISLITQA